MVRSDVKQITHSMSKEKYERIKKMHANSKSDKKLSGWLLEVALYAVEKNDFISRVAPKFSLVAINEESIIIQDKKIEKTRLTMIEIHNGKLWCDLDEKDDCEHIHYALMLPQLSKIKEKLKQI